MRLNSLQVENYRGFEELDLAFEPDVTVLIGVNGAGKTSLLDAIAMMLAFVASTIQIGLPGPSLMSLDDLHVGKTSGLISLSAEIFGTPITLGTKVQHPVLGPEKRNTMDGMMDALHPLGATHPRKPKTYDSPLAIYFPTNRSVFDVSSHVGIRRNDKERESVFDAHDRALAIGASNFRGFFEWFREEEDIYNEQMALSDAERPAPEELSKLPSVRRAIERLFPGARELRVERRSQRMTLLHRGVRVDVAQLSDGERCLVAMAGDLARRMVLAAAPTSDPLSVPVVVLIDEIELHLHPGLQRQIIPRLRSIFPNAQWIVSTHSPQVLSSVRSTNVRLLENFKLVELNRGTWQRDTNRILEAAFGDPGRPPEVARKLNELRNAVDEEKNDDARRLISELRSMVEGEDPDVFFYEQLLGLQEKEQDPS